MALVRTLNGEGIAKFSDYLAALRKDLTLLPPAEILTDGRYSDPFEPPVVVDDRAFADAYQLGLYLNDAFVSCEDRIISRNHGLWSWLGLFYFNELSKRSDDGARKVLENAVYVLDARFSFRKYYRHAVRTPWLAVKEHGEYAKVLLLMSGRGLRSDIGEQLGAYQDLFANRTVISAAYAMYFDGSSQKPRKGTGTKGAGSPRRLSSVSRQLELTYDLQDCGLEHFLSLLPREFKTWVQRARS